MRGCCWANGHGTLWNVTRWRVWVCRADDYFHKLRPHSIRWLCDWHDRIITGGEA